MIISLPWPDPLLFPNRRRGKRLFDREIIAQHRFDAKISALAGRKPPIALYPTKDLACKISFHPPDRRRRDLDGMLSACKPYLDGIAEAYGIDDRQLNPIILVRLEKKKGGEVIFEF